MIIRTQQSLFDLLDAMSAAENAPQKTEEAGDAPRLCSIGVSCKSPEDGYYCIGSARMMIDPASWTPDAETMLDNIRTLDYYAGRVLTDDMEIDVFVHELNEDGLPEPGALPVARHKLSAASVKAAIARRTAQ